MVKFSVPLLGLFVCIFFCIAISFFCYLDNFCWFAHFATYVSLYIFSYSAFELRSVFILFNKLRSVPFSALPGKAVPEMICTVSGGTLNSTHSLTDYVSIRRVIYTGPREVWGPRRRSKI